jgi:cell shape-determining protein MreC
MDQVFGAQLKFEENRKTIGTLRNKIRKMKDKAHFASSLRNIRVETERIDSITSKMTEELFELFNWNRIRTSLHVEWKEYFHMLYEILVYDEGDYDYSIKVIMARAVVEYHDYMEPPERVPYNDPMFAIISSIDSLFRDLKREQAIVAERLSDLKDVLRAMKRKSTDIQCELVEMQKHVRELERDNKKYAQILRWSAM